MTLFVGFGFASVAFWGYFRFQPEPAPVRPDLAPAPISAAPAPTAHAADHTLDLRGADTQPSQRPTP